MNIFLRGFWAWSYLQAHPDAREMFRAFFVVAGARRKTIELSVRSLCTTARSTDPEVGYKPQSPLKLEYIRQENSTSTDCAFFSQVDYFRIARDSARIPQRRPSRLGHFIPVTLARRQRTLSKV